MSNLISLDTETTGLDLRHSARPFFVTICHSDHPLEPTYWEWEVDPITRMPIIPQEDKTEIANIVYTADEIVMQNGKFDAGALHAAGIVTDFPWYKTHELLYLAHLLASNQPKDLTTLAMIYLNVNIKPYEEALAVACKEARAIAKKQYPDWLIANSKGVPGFPSIKGGETLWKYDMWLPRAIAQAECYDDDHPWWNVLSEYSNADSMVTLPLLEALRKKVDDRNLGKIAEWRRGLQSIVFNMEQTKLPISKSRVYELKHQYTNTAEVCNNICVNLSNGTLDHLPGGVSNQLREVVFNQLKLKSDRKTDTGNASMDKHVIKEWLTTLPKRSLARTFIENLNAFRKRSTALSFIKSYENYWIDDGSDMCGLYPSVNPVGTDTLRWSGQNPNNMQISKQEIEEFTEDEVELYGKKNRSAKCMFGPEPDREWWSNDASNIELRIPGYKAEEELMIELFEHPNDPPYFGSNHLLFFSILHPDKYDHDDPNGLLKAKKKYASTWYQWTKNGNFAVQYGAVAESGTADRAYNVVGGQAMIEARLKNIKKYSQSQIKFAQKYGYVETVPDKTIDPNRGYPLLCTRSKWGKIVETVPLSYHVQGTAMQWMCQAMLRVQEYLNKLNLECGIPNHYRIAIQVHDELVFDFPKGTGPEPWKTNLPIIRNVVKLMQMGGDGIGVPTPVNCEYHEHNWQEGRTISL